MPRSPVLAILDRSDPFAARTDEPPFQEQDMRDLSAIPGAEDALVALARDSSAAPKQRYAAAEALLEGSFSKWRTLPAGNQAVAQALAVALRNDSSHNRWGLPGEFAGRLGDQFLSLSEGVDEALTPLLDQKTELHIIGSEAATLQSRAHYRISDLAAYLLSRRHGIPWKPDMSAARRDDAVARLRAALQKMPGNGSPRPAADSPPGCLSEKKTLHNDDQTRERRLSPLDMSSGRFRALGHQLVDRIALFLEALPGQRVTPAESPSDVRKALGADRSLPQVGADPAQLLEHAADLLFDHSLFNGHPRFWGYITSSAAPIGALGELLAAAVNPNVGAWLLSPMASEIEAQTVRWIAEMLKFPQDCGGLFVSGGNMANLVCFLAARQAKAGWDVRSQGMNGTRLRTYCSKETHTWIQKAADVSGLGTDSIRWISTDRELRIDAAALRAQIRRDIDAGDKPFLVVGTAGSVGTGAIDPLPELAAICREFDLWFHVDGAYGGLAAVLPDAPAALAGLSEADSVAVDPHKWLYAPLEAGCALVRRPERLRDAFAYHPPYYHFGTEATNYFDLGIQNSRGFRALKVWLALQQVGREGYVQMLSEDIRLAGELFRGIARYPELQAFTLSLSIATFRYVPCGLDPETANVGAYLDQLNRELLTRLQDSGEAYLSNAVIFEKFVLRACIVNFRTSLEDVDALAPLVIRIGRELDLALRPHGLKSRAS